MTTVTSNDPSLEQERFLNRPSNAPLLEIRDLHVQFSTDIGLVRAVEGVSFQIGRGEVLAVVGESGSGKSVTAMSILRLIESQGGQITKGSIQFEGKDLLAFDEEALRAIRGNEIAMIFQEPMTSLNPVYTVGDQIGESLTLHRGLAQEAVRAEVVRLLTLVGIADAENRVDEYPHQLSGGMRQRVMIAMALACDPRLLIADEPTTALDVTVQAQILELLQELQAKLGMSILLITHDLGVVASVAQRAVVMYAGRVVECAPVEEIFENPKHPYTVGLLRSVPKLGQLQGRLEPIAGNVPDALSLPPGCRFHPRCPFRMPRCDQETPTLRSFGSAQHQAACFWSDENPERSLLDIHPKGAEVST
ncbi:MAG TPA: ABC transporter ATP-binding protein [Polyangiaceae bacterium]|nr:ABC transporter ATP-binding protein [Polyangiaceae bacterium]